MLENIIINHQRIASLFLLNVRGRLTMQIEKLQHKQPGLELPCFRCHGMTAEYRVTMAIGEHCGRLTVCLCEACMQLSETELYAHFTVRRTDENRPETRTKTGSV